MRIEEILKRDESFRYQLLDRMRTDCEYYLGNGNRDTKFLWADTEKEHIDYMKALWESFPEDKKPEWLSFEKIIEYEKEMVVPDLEMRELISRGLDEEIIVLSVRDNTMSAQIGDYWFYFGDAAYIPDDFDFSSLSKEVLVSHIESALEDLKENLGKEEFLYYKATLTEELNRAGLLTKKDFFNLCMYFGGISESKKEWEVAIQNAIETACPNKQWYDVTKISIFVELLSGKSPKEVSEMVWPEVEKENSISKSYKGMPGSKLSINDLIASGQEEIEPVDSVQKQEKMDFNLSDRELDLVIAALDAMGDRVADREGYSSGEAYWDLKEKFKNEKELRSLKSKENSKTGVEER